MNRTLIAVPLLITSLAAGQGIPTEKQTAVSYAEIKPIFREHCFGCHNQDKKRGGLSLESYAAALEGGSSGEVISPGDLDSSRLWQLINHDDSPEMPPDQDRIAETKLALIRRWIEQGAAESSGTAKRKPPKPSLSFHPVAVDRGAPGAMPNNQCLQPVVVTRRAAAISALAISPRAPLVAVGGQQQVALYHAESHELLGIFPFPEGVPYVVKFSRDGSLLLVGGGRGADSGCVALYDVVTGRRIVRLGDELDVVLAADVDASLSYVAFGGPTKIVKIVSTQTGAELFRMQKHTDWIQAIEFSPDGQLLATADRAGGLVVWESATAREHQVYEGHKTAITAVSWRADGRLFATSSEAGNLRLWSRHRKKPNKNWAAHAGGASWVQFSMDGGLVSHGRDRQAKSWDENGKLLRTFEPQPDIGMRVAVTADAQRVVAGDWSGQVWSFQMAGEKHLAELPANPPPIGRRITKRVSLRDAALAVVTRLQDESARHEAALHKAQHDYLITLDALSTAELEARELALQSYELQRIRESDLADSEDEAAQQATKLHSQRRSRIARVHELCDLLRASLLAIDKSRAERRQVDQDIATTQQTVTLHNKRLKKLQAALIQFETRKSQLAESVTASERRVAELSDKLREARALLAAREQSAEKDADQQQQAAVEGEVHSGGPANVADLTALVMAMESELAKAEQSASRAREDLEFFTAAYD